MKVFTVTVDKKNVSIYLLISQVFDLFVESFEQFIVIVMENCSTNSITRLI